MVNLLSAPIKANTYWNQGKWKQTTALFTKNMPLNDCYNTLIKFC